MGHSIAVMTVALETPSGSIIHDGQFPERLRRSRLRHGLSQRALAKKARLRKTGYRNIEDWEAGRSSPRVGGPILPVAKALGVSVAWLMWGEESNV